MARRTTMQTDPLVKWARRGPLLALLSTLALLSCAAPANPGGATGQAPQTQTGPKRLIVAIQGRPVSGYAKLNVNTSEHGNSEMAAMLHRGLTDTDPNGQMRPQMAEATPSADNGLWQIAPDGRMDLTWKIRPGAAWHDGVQLTGNDLLFTFDVVRDHDLAIFRDRSFDLVATVESLAPDTVTAHWKQPYIRADQMFSGALAMPLPKHLLEAAFQGDKSAFLQAPYWTTQFVGLGPYKLKDWVPASKVIVQANDRFVLGRPKIDEIELQTIPDGNAILATFFSGSVDAILDRALSVDHVLLIRERMPDAQVETPLTSMLVLNTQMLNPNPAVILDLRFRQAMMHAVDRQQMADTIDYGLVPVAQGFVYPTLKEGQAIQSAVVRYEYDPRRSAQLLDELGYVRGTDGFLRGGQGPLPGGEDQLPSPSGLQALLAQQLRVQVRATASDINTKTMYSAADFLQKVGIGVDTVVIPEQLVNDQEYRSTFPGLIVNGGPAGANELESLHSRNARIPENRFQGGNRSRYMSPELDALIDRYITTISFEARMDAAREIAGHVTTNLPLLPLFFDTWPDAVSSRVVNVGVGQNGAPAAANVEQWDLR